MLIRPLTMTDARAAFAISCAAGWNQTESDWLMMLRLNPETCFGVECEGELAATAVLTCYQLRLAWVGMVLTAVRFQRRGFARALLERVLREADTRGIQTVKLDATEQGQPLYDRLGFVPEQQVERWRGRGIDEGSRATIGVPDWKLDAEAFGANREGLLGQLGERAPIVVGNRGYAMRREGVRASYLGPCVARSPGEAELLVRAVLRQDAGPWLWDLMPENGNAVRLARSLGFAVDRKLVRMYRGDALRAKESLVYGLAGFEFG